MLWPRVDKNIEYFRDELIKKTEKEACDTALWQNKTRIPKVPETYVEQTAIGAYVAIITFLGGADALYSEMNYYFGQLKFRSAQIPIWMLSSSLMLTWLLQCLVI